MNHETNATQDTQEMMDLIVSFLDTWHEQNHAASNEEDLSDPIFYGADYTEKHDAYTEQYNRLYDEFYSLFSLKE